MPQLHPPIPISRVHRKSARRAHSDGDLLESRAAILQRQVGNRAVQRALAQRQIAQRQEGDAPKRGFNPFDPRVIDSAVRSVVAQGEAPVRNYLNANTARLRLMTMDELVAQVRQGVPGSSLADGEIQSLVREWAGANNVTIPVLPLAAPARPGLQIPDVVKKAFSIPLEGLDVIDQPDGRLNISVKGATAKLSRGELSLGWTGSLGVNIPIEGFQLAGKIDKNHWEINFSTPGESSMPDLTKLAEVFTKAETALRGILLTTARLNKLDNVAAITAAITPNIKPVKEGVQALVDIARAPSVSAGVSLSGPTQGEQVPSSGGSNPGGITFSATLTIKF